MQTCKYFSNVTLQSYCASLITCVTYLYNYLPFRHFSGDAFAKMICALVLMIGCLSIIIGHKYACIDRLLSSCMVGGIFGYTIGTSTGDYSIASNYTSIFYRNKTVYI